MKILEKLEQIADLGQSNKKLQTEMNVIEAGHIWNLLTSRYEVIETTQLLQNFAGDPDLKLILNEGLKFLKRQVDALENIAGKYGLPLPKKPPAASNSAVKVEVITDEFIFKRVFSGIQSFVSFYGTAMIQTTSAKLREEFLRYLQDELKLYDKLVVYGQLKGWLLEPPAYRI